MRTTIGHSDLTVRSIGLGCMVRYFGLPFSSQFSATFLLGCTRGGSPGILG